MEEILRIENNIPTSVRFHIDFWRYITNNITAIVESNTIRSLTVKEIIRFVGRPEVKRNANPKDLKHLLLSAQVAELVNPRPSATATERHNKPSKLCVVCQDKVLERVVEPCGHLCLCRECADKLQKDSSKRCPLCQDEFTSISKVCFP